ncbi:cyclin-dependent kinase inhibitor 5-like isoform X2 [Syzygium oleosum]|uniref:cyclin-dependent kinase inhibitor 5-like isoform X2 n=1 Tax=Syzygium oleosum TaxID=219896 RepID=UPI0024B8D623|nr:cyclin-dependent kinase inhibitor 5-like isoform X2 [Syzygium oleosum]
MGKYIRKAKAAGELAVMEATQSSLGVRTRAKTLASQRLQKSPPVSAAAAAAAPPQPAAQAPAAAASSGSGSYLQLRSRRLPKPPILVRSHYARRQRKVGGSAKGPSPGSSPNPRARSRLRIGSMESVGSFLSDTEGGGNRKASGGGGEEGKDGIPREENAAENDNECSSNADLGVGEASFGDNVLEFEGRERSTRESTPCSLIRDPEVVRTPSSTTRPTTLTETNRRIHNVDGRHIPTTHEMNEFFAGAEEEQQRNFIEKYNFDPVSDKPLPGRFEWQKLDP